MIGLTAYMHHYALLRFPVAIIHLLPSLEHHAERLC